MHKQQFDLQHYNMHGLLELINKSTMYLTSYNPVPGLQTRFQKGVRGVSHFHVVSGSLDMKNHRGACPPGGPDLRYGPNPKWPPSAIMKFQLFYFLEYMQV